MPPTSCRVEASDTFQRPTMHETDPTTRNDLTQNVSSVKAEKPRLSVIIAILKTAVIFLVVFLCQGLARGRGVCILLLSLVGLGVWEG